MRLISIRLHGFKSFAQHSEFPIRAPLMGIIGPNGCGKSNIIDAVRWVLGESTAKHLRGQSAQDVIFSGSANRKPAQSASVELIFDNREGKVSGAFSAFDELVISRKITADGQSIYQINQKVVRRRDVVELLQTAGVSARSYAVIEQGMISRIIEAKPEEIRGFIEESSGIAVYKTRRKETEQRMNEVQEHLSRHDERLFNLAKQKDKLALEAEIAQKFKNLQQVQEQKTHRLRSFQYHQLQTTIQQAIVSIQETQNKLDALHLNVQQVEIQRLSALHQEALRQYQGVKNQHLQALQHKTHAEQQYERNVLRLDFNGQQQRESQNLMAHIQSEIQQKEQQIQENRDKIQHQERQIGLLSPKIIQIRQQADGLRHQHEQNRLVQQEKIQKNKQLQRQQQQLNADCQQIQQRLHTWQQRIQQLEAENQKNETAFHDYQPELEQLNREEALLSAKVQELQQNQQSIQAQLKIQRQTTQEAKRIFFHSQSQLQALEALQREKSVYRPDLSQVLSRLTITPQWEKAVQTYLQEALFTPFSPHPEDWAKALKEGQSLLGLASIPSAWAQIISGDADLSLYFKHLKPLAKHNADIQKDDLKQGENYLTLDGTVMNSHSVKNHLENQSVIQLQRIQELKNQLPEQESAFLIAENRESALNEQGEQLQEALQRAQNAFNQHRHQRQNLENQANIQAQNLAYQEKLRQNNQLSLEALHQDIQQLKEQYEEKQQEILIISEQLLDLTEDLSDDHILTASTELQTIQQEQQRLEQEQREQQNLLIDLKSQFRHHQENQARLHQEAQKQQEKQGLLNQESEKINEENAVFSLQIETFSQQIEALSADLQEKDLVQQSTARQVREAEKLAENERQQEQILKERLVLQNNQLNQLNSQAEDLKLEFEQREPIQFLPDETVQTAELNAEIRQIKQAISDLGAVNLSAILDYEVIKRDHDTLAEQCADLRQSLDLLNTAIEKLDAETRERLTTTLNAVNVYFSEHFSRLFHGGSASLNWTSHDVLEAGVNIQVGLMGKKLRHLSALSGGEKALSALSLVFALFRLNPAPFCLLDEVDAPLDEANVGRLCDLLQDISQSTQLIIITHRKKTMTACSQLIGVTMSEPGVSRLVGVDFNGEIK